MSELIILGQIINPISDKKADWIPDGAILAKRSLTKEGEVYKIKEVAKKDKILKSLKGKSCRVIDLSDEVIIPPFFDIHFHWVQDDVRLMPKDYLLEWLDKYTFPTEMKFKSASFAKKKAKFFFSRLIKSGTLGGAIYSSIHENALHEAMENAVGDFVIGNVLMTQNSPKKLTQDKKEAQKLALKLSRKYKERYAVTPRFAISTDMETMKETASSAKKNKSFIQTHLSENLNEIDFTMSLYKEAKNYTDVYKKAGLLSSKTIMGHAIHLSDSELEVLKNSKTILAHCPTSNAPLKEKGLGSGLFNFKKVEKFKIPWALATDIGGGPYLSMFDVMRSFVEQNKKAKVSEATFTKALYRSTVSGAEALRVSQKKGNFEPNKELNFITFYLKGSEALKSSEEVLEKFIMKNKKNREEYETATQRVFYKNNFLYQKDS